MSYERETITREQLNYNLRDCDLFDENIDIRTIPGRWVRHVREMIEYDWYCLLCRTAPNVSVYEQMVEIIVDIANNREQINIDVFKAIFNVFENNGVEFVFKQGRFYRMLIKSKREDIILSLLKMNEENIVLDIEELYNKYFGILTYSYELNIILKVLLSERNVEKDRLINVCDCMVERCKDDFYNGQRQLLEEIIKILLQKISDDEYNRRLIINLENYEDVKIFIETIINNIENIQ